MLPIVLFLAFLVLPVLEIYVIIQVGTVIGGWPTVALLLVESLLGAWIVRREGRRAWRALREAFSGGEMPDRELADAGLVLIGGALLLTPGFITDVAGFMFVLPFTRPLVRRALVRYVGRRVRITQERMVERMSATVAGGVFPPGGPAHRPGGHPGGQDGPVIRGEVVREDRPEP
ncbi:FxsA family protein [Actinomadura scrupuli]|uniref:FxsA family protein n=1 Tax=Actinomadura scrupuli TaxID=559629 RepID=UPI003D99714F